MKQPGENAMTLRVGIIGTGENARDHGRACRRVPDAELVAICDVSEEALHRFGDEFAVSRRYSHLEDMLNENALDIVIVSTWGVYHAEVCCAVARSGKVRAILVEKPISATATECESMIVAARESGTLLTEGFTFRYDSQHLRVKEIVDSGRLGEVKSIHGTFSSPLVTFAARSNWRFSRERGGSSVLDTASYLIHFARYLIGTEPKRVYAAGSYLRDSDVDASAAIFLQFPANVTANLTSSYEYGYCQSTTVLCTRGWIRVDLPFDQRSARLVEFVEKEDLPAIVTAYHDNFDTEVYQFASKNRFERQLDHLCQCLTTGKPPIISPEFSLGNMRVIDAVFASMRSGQLIDM
jgi:predicted dehydrogenase